MAGKGKNWIALSLALFWLGLAAGSANTFMRLHSSYLGDGWFQYRMQVENDPFFLEAGVSYLIGDFTNSIDHATSFTNWVYSELGTSWTFEDPTRCYPYPTRPYEGTFWIRSSETSYKIGAGSAVVGLILKPLGYTPPSGTYSDRVVGYTLASCLIPCSPEESDNSPTNHVCDVKLIADPIIKELIITNGEIRGIKFEAFPYATHILQATFDFQTWTNIANIWSAYDEREKIWISSASLSGFGKFFRLLAIPGHIGEPSLAAYPSLQVRPTLAASSPSALTTTAIDSCKIVGGKAMVAVTTRAGETYEIQALDWHNAVIQTQRVTAKGTSAVVSFDTSSLPSPVFFKVTSAK